MPYALAARSLGLSLPFLLAVFLFANPAVAPFPSRPFVFVSISRTLVPLSPLHPVPSLLLSLLPHPAFHTSFTAAAPRPLASRNFVFPTATATLGLLCILASCPQPATVLVLSRPLATCPSFLRLPPLHKGLPVCLAALPSPPAYRPQPVPLPRNVIAASPARQQCHLRAAEMAFGLIILILDPPFPPAAAGPSDE